jgi:hypothetical protein
MTARSTIDLHGSSTRTKSIPWRVMTAASGQQRLARADRHIDQNAGIDEGGVELVDLDIGDHPAVLDLRIDLGQPALGFCAGGGKADFRAWPAIDRRSARAPPGAEKARPNRWSRPVRPA